MTIQDVDRAKANRRIDICVKMVADFGYRRQNRLSTGFRIDAEPGRKSNV